MTYKFLTIIFILLYKFCIICSSVNSENILIINGTSKSLEIENILQQEKFANSAQIQIIKNCSAKEALKSIVNNGNKSTLVYIENGCVSIFDFNEIYESPFCWKFERTEKIFVISCGSKNENALKKYKKRIYKKRNLASNIPHFFSIFAEATGDTMTKTGQNYRNLQLKQSTKKAKIEKEDDNDDGDKLKLDKKAKLSCKYRKSCYNGNARNEIHPEQKQTKMEEKHENEDIDEMPAEDKDNEINKEISKGNENQLKIICKYRYSCYKNKGLKLNNKKEKEATSNILTKKRNAQNTPAKKYQKVASTKDVAINILRNAKKKEKLNVGKPKYSKAEKMLMDIKKEKKSKIACKYRKSCYNTGKVPEIEASRIVQAINNLMSYASNDKSEKNEPEEKDFESLTQTEQKLFCKYRKSCYESGRLPEFESAKRFEYKDVLHSVPKKVPITLRCKYRKSCYESGVLPADLNPKIEVKKEKKFKGKVFPATENELKLYCKYRKNCYKEMSEKSEVDKEDDEHEEIEKLSPIMDDEIEIEESEKIKEDISEETAEEEQIEKAEELTTEKIELEEEKDDLIHTKKRRTKIKQKNKTPATTKIISEKPKEKESKNKFCDEVVSSEKSGSGVKKDVSISKKIKGKQPTPRPTNEELSSHAIVVISRKKHLRKFNKNKISENETSEEVLDKIESIEDENEEKMEVENGDHEEMNEEEEEVLIIENELIENIDKDVNENEINDEEIEQIEEEVEEQVMKNNENASKNEEDEEDVKKDNADDRKKIEKMDKITNKVLSGTNIAKLKLDCKYRKSCYNEVNLQNNADKNVEETIIIQSTNPKNINYEKNWSRIKKDEQLKCKYRKSCYDSHIDRDESVARIIHDNRVVKINAPKSNSNNNHHPNLPSKVVKNETSNGLEIDINLLSRKTKNQCKYKYSCYERIVPVVHYSQATAKSEKNLAGNQSARSSLASLDEIDEKRQLIFMLPNGTSCNKYRLSCRERVGLPPKERAPLGPNGRKLCRKKKTDNK